MGKYFRKAKVSGEVAVMELVGASLTGGVRTRARTLALQRLQSSGTGGATDDSESSKSYLELRSRRLEKCFVSSPKKASSAAKMAAQEKSPATATAAAAAEVSLGENVLEAEPRDARETTPCSLIRAPESIQTPGSSTKPPNSATSRRRAHISTPQNPNIPIAREMEEFFARAEQQQQTLFSEKYNFDPAKDCPLPGRFIWVKLDL